MDLSKTKIVRYNGDDWSGLYIDGKLVADGDPYVANDYLTELLNVEDREGLAPFLGTENHVEKDLSKVEAYERKLEELEEFEDDLAAEAEELERQAEALRARAASLRNRR